MGERPTVTLTVTDNDGVSDSDSTQANIGQSNQPPVGNLPPVADANGQYKLQVYADGFAPNIQVFDEFSRVNDVRMARSSECD